MDIVKGKVLATQPELATLVFSTGDADRFLQVCKQGFQPNEALKRAIEQAACVERATYALPK
jgi:hypothetical protein